MLAMHTPKVIDLDTRRRSKSLERLTSSFDPEGLFRVCIDEVHQYHDSANTSKSDPITLHGSALLGIKRLLTRFGIEVTPLTYGELMGAMHYCKAVHGFAWQIQSDAKNDALWESLVEKNVREMLPELLDSLLAYKAGDVEALRKIARTRLTLSVMADHYLPEHGGWVSNWEEMHPAKKNRKQKLPV